MNKYEPLWEEYGQNPRKSQSEDVYNHGFVYMYHRSTWMKQPFPDVETVGTKDADFIKQMKKHGLTARPVEPRSAEALAAVGWHRDATCGAKEAPANINHSQVLNFMMFRGEEVERNPRCFSAHIPLIKETASELVARRERYLKDLVDEHGSLQVCAFCNFAVTLSRCKKAERTVSEKMCIVDAYEGTQSYDRFNQKFDVGEYSSAGGAVAEGHWQPTNGNWLRGQVQRMAICRNCGFQLGWRFEPEGAPKECNSPGCTYLANQSLSGRNKDYCCSGCARGSADPSSWGTLEHDGECQKLPVPKIEGPVFWSFIWRHVRERNKPGEHVPEESDRSRHTETVYNRKKKDVCPQGHKLRCFCTGQGNGGALPLYYICDVCDVPARGAQHLWGCGSCDYDMCDKCMSKR